MSPEQKVFTKLRRICVDLFGASNVYDYLPDKEVNYPFVFIGEQFSQTYREHKDGRNKNTQTTIHVWHDDHRKRGSLSGMIQSIEKAIVEEFGTDGENYSSQIIVDNTTSVPLMHGIIEPNIKI